MNTTAAGGTGRTARTMEDETPGEEAPWIGGTHLEVQAQGLLLSRDTVRKRSVGAEGGNEGTYTSQVLGSRETQCASLDSSCEGARYVVVQKPAGGPTNEDGGIKYGHDRLKVRHNAERRFKSHTLMMSGRLRRTYRGGFIKAASMEGIMCGGAMTKAIAGPSATMSPLASSDVYGGSAKVAVARIQMALMHYRSSMGAVRAHGIYVRNATFSIEPLVSVHAQPQQGAAAAKLARLGKVLGVAKMFCPLLDIACGLAGFVVGMGAGLFGLIRRAIKGPKPPPPQAMTPRVHNRNHGFLNEGFTMALFI